MGHERATATLSEPMPTFQHIWNRKIPVYRSFVDHE